MLPFSLTAPALRLPSTRIWRLKSFHSITLTHLHSVRLRMKRLGNSHLIAHIDYTCFNVVVDLLCSLYKSLAMSVLSQAHLFDICSSFRRGLQEDETVLLGKFLSLLCRHSATTLAEVINATDDSDLTCFRST